MRKRRLPVSLLLVLSAAVSSSASAQTVEDGRRFFEAGRNADARAVFLRLRESDAATGVHAYYLGRIAVRLNDLDDGGSAMG